MGADVFGVVAGRAAARPLSLRVPADGPPRPLRALLAAPE